MNGYAKNRALTRLKAYLYSNVISNKEMGFLVSIPSLKIIN